MKPLNKLSVPEQVIIYGYFDLVDNVAIKIFEITQAELFIIKKLAEEKFAPKTVSINPKLYANEINTVIDGYEAPRFGTKIKRQRGRPGLNIIKAFASIPSTPVPALQFAKDHGITINTLKQHSRFDKIGMEGQVKVRQDINTKVLMVSREKV